MGPWELERDESRLGSRRGQLLSQWRARQHLLKQRVRAPSQGLPRYKQLVLMGWVVFPTVIIQGKGAAKATERHVNSEMGSSAQQLW